MLEKVIEKKLVRVVKENGGLCIKMASMYYKGIPDRLILTADGRLMFVETKRPGEQLRPEQVAWQKKLQGMKFKAVMIDSVENLEAIKSFLR